MAERRSAFVAARDIPAMRDIPSEWRDLFRSPALDTLIKERIAGNPNLRRRRQP
jgi:hypothetical protein